MTDHDTMKRIFETTGPDQFGRAVAPSNRGGAGRGRVSSPIPLSASYIQEARKRPSKQYTPSGAHDWPKPMTPRKVVAYLLMSAGAVVGVWLGAHIGFAMLVGG